MGKYRFIQRHVEYRNSNLLQTARIAVTKQHFKTMDVFTLGSVDIQQPPIGLLEPEDILPVLAEIEEKASNRKVLIVVRRGEEIPLEKYFVPHELYNNQFVCLVIHNLPPDYTPTNIDDTKMAEFSAYYSRGEKK